MYKRIKAICYHSAGVQLFVNEEIIVDSLEWFTSEI